MKSRITKNKNVPSQAGAWEGEENEKLQPGTYEVTFDASLPGLGSYLSSGIYFYKLTTEKFTATKSMIIIK